MTNELNACVVHNVDENSWVNNMTGQKLPAWHWKHHEYLARKQTPPETRQQDGPHQITTPRHETPPSPPAHTHTHARARAQQDMRAPAVMHQSTHSDQRQRASHHIHIQPQQPPRIPNKWHPGAGRTAKAGRNVRTIDGWIVGACSDEQTSSPRTEEKQKRKDKTTR
jgi:hypothetical protein